VVAGPEDAVAVKEECLFGGRKKKENVNISRLSLSPSPSLSLFYADSSGCVKGFLFLFLLCSGEIKRWGESGIRYDRTSNWSMNDSIPALSPVRYFGGAI